MKSIVIDKQIVAAGLAVLGLASTAPASRAATVTPSKTTVLILPVLDQEAEPRMVGLHVAVATHRVEYDLLARQFVVIGPTMAKSATASSKVSLTDAAARTTDNFKKLADASGANWVVSVNLLEYKHDTFTPGNRTDHAKLHIQVYDASKGELLADKDVTKTDNSSGRGIGVLGLMEETIDVTMQQALKNLIAPYPATVKVDDELGAEDYLLNQTKPVSGDPAKLFTALGAPPPSTGSVQVTN